MHKPLLIAAQRSLLTGACACLLLLALPAAGHAAKPAGPSDAAGEQDEAAPEIITVVLETTKGDIELEVHPAWSPLGVEHFLELVEAKFYDGAPWFRVIEGFVAQCGIAADPQLNAEWSEQTIADEPVVQGNAQGYVAFGKSSQPDSRSTHIYINYKDNSKALDPQGFSCFAKVSAGMDVALELYKCQWDDQAGLALKGGMAAFARLYPEADYITRAYIKEAPSGEE